MRMRTEHHPLVALAPPVQRAKSGARTFHGRGDVANRGASARPPSRGSA